MKRWLASVLEKCPSKLQRGINAYPSEWPSSKSSTKFKWWGRRGKQEVFLHCGRGCKWAGAAMKEGNVKMAAAAAAAAAGSLQSCPTLCDPIDGSPPGSPVLGILQARTLEWVAICSSNAWKWKVEVKSLSHVWLLATPCTAAYEAPSSMEFSRQENWSGVPLPNQSLVKDLETRSPWM